MVPASAQLQNAAASPPPFFLPSCTVSLLFSLLLATASSLKCLSFFPSNFFLPLPPKSSFPFRICERLSREKENSLLVQASWAAAVGGCQKRSVNSQSRRGGGVQGNVPISSDEIFLLQTEKKSKQKSLAGTDEPLGSPALLPLASGSGSSGRGLGKVAPPAKKKALPKRFRRGKNKVIGVAGVRREVTRLIIKIKSLAGSFERIRA